MESSVIGIITTKNRPKFLMRAVYSALSQTRKPEMLIVCSDSDNLECVEYEKKYMFEKNILYIHNNFCKNCSGVRNSAVYYYIKRNIKSLCDFDTKYIAFLDDDDEWDKSYIEKCYMASTNGSDFVVSGIVFRKGNEEKALSIPNELSISAFLQGNPHIQGSNIFVKLSTLLKSGLFDENLSSSVDRDLLIRLMQLKPKYTIINEHLVYVNVDNTRWRISNSIEQKKQDLRKFYLKYASLMSKEVEEIFFARNKKLFDIDKNDIVYNPAKISHTSNTPVIQNSLKYEGRIVVGIVITNPNLGRRLINEILNLNLRIKIVIVKNYNGTILSITDIISKYSCEVYIHNCNKTIREICTTRNILFDTLYNQSCKEDVIWVLDDDMQLSYISSNGEKLKTDISAAIYKYKGKYHAIVGDYTMDPPLPTLSVVRTKLVDYMYHKSGYRGGIVLDNMKDYYYDLSERTGEHLETPFLLQDEELKLNAIFSGKATSRFLYLDFHEDKQAINCGGNVIIFYRELLKIKHNSLSIANNVGRRSDFFWVLESIRNGYNIANVPFATLHNRSISSFNYERESNKLLRDIIGSSCTKTIEKIGISYNYSLLSTTFMDILISRLSKYIMSYYRIMGILQILDEKEYSPYFTTSSLINFIKRGQEIAFNTDLNKEWKNLIQKLNKL